MDVKRILFVAGSDPSDIRTFSGIAYHALKALRTRYTVDSVFPDTIPVQVRLYNKIMLMLFGKRNRVKNSVIYARAMAQQIHNKLKHQSTHYDLIVFFNCIQLLSYFNKSLFPACKVIYYSDATFQLGLNYYPALKNLLKFNIREGHLIEKNAYNRADMLLFSSDWAANSAVHFYNVNPDKIHVLKYGANMPAFPPIERNFDERIRLLLVGVDWYRKGINVAVEVCRQLQGLNYDTELTIIGLKQYPDDLKTNAAIRIIPFLDKSQAKSIAELQGEFRRSNYFLFPTVADCTPIVLAEAMLFGLPIIARNTGGISAMVQHGVNGILVPEEGTSADFVSGILAIHNSGSYERYSQNSRLLYDTCFNWENWLTKFSAYISLIK
jgi:glycosyltransferase involved in cell wall biosynthesis